MSGGPDSAPLRRDRSFVTYWIAQTVSVAGDSFAYIAVPLLVLHATGSVARMGLLTAVAGAASVGAGVFGGVLVDRFDRRRLMIVADLVRLVLYALIPLAWLAGPQVWLLFVVLPVCEAVGMVFQVASVTAVRNLVHKDHITEANGRLHATWAATAVVGPVLAGLVSARFGPAAAVGINAASFALSAAGLWLVRLRSPDTDEAAPRREKALVEFLAGARFLWRQPVLRSLTVLLSVFVFLTFGLTDVLIYHVRHDLGGSDRTVGTVLGLATLGTVAGALLVAPLRRRRGFGVTWIGAHAVCGVAIAGLGLTGSVPAVTVVAAGYLCCVSIGGICSMSLRQEITPDHLLGRVTSAFWSTHFSLGPAGAAALTWAAGRYGVSTVCLVAGAGCLLVAVGGLCTPIRRAAPAAVDDEPTLQPATT
ncbi:Predicted arabinose efflux permease, MFS family [Micromonospora rhizosphaerae]|uniref:Predicted arabinose efflux permease, MFS family n=1 Tax=Micromonospora rhizosphaerae TaxID=568872 RepID=A0A1C6S223_9ACTN|nr:MFS transporter [Micromonospora rhizosphaerae]SCL23524.1 Predicted arabinose efflux permease, MFS family [Micromonospora rhizosphaerae]